MQDSTHEDLERLREIAVNTVAKLVCKLAPFHILISGTKFQSIPKRTLEHIEINYNNVIQFVKVIIYDIGQATDDTWLVTAKFCDVDNISILVGYENITITISDLINIIDFGSVIVGV